MNTEQPTPPAVVLSTAQLDHDPERANRCLEALRVVLGIDSPETRGWAPIVQQEARRAIDRALAALAEQSAQIEQLSDAVRTARADEAHFWTRSVDGLTAQLREVDARYMALLKAVADGVAMQPKTVVLHLGSNAMYTAKPAI